MKRILPILLLLSASALAQVQIGANVRVGTSAAERARKCELHIWGSGASTQFLTPTTDNEAASCYNSFGVSVTVTAVRCWANAGSPTIRPTNESVSGHNLLSSDLTCGTASWNAGSLTATGADLIEATSGTFGIGIITNPSNTATNIRVVIEFTLNTS